MAEHPFIETVECYFKGCNTADVSPMLSCFAEDVQAYFVDIPPITGSKDLATFWAEFYKATGSVSGHHRLIRAQFAPPRRREGLARGRAHSGVKVTLALEA